MRGNIFSQPYITSNIIAILFIIIAIVRPLLCRSLLSLVFVAAGIINAIVAIHHPEVYKIYGSLAALPVYENFINGVFSRHTTAFVLAIAVAQLLIGFGLAWKGIYEIIALSAAIIFLLAVAPLGAGSAFPSTVILAIACGILFRKKQTQSLLIFLLIPISYLQKTFL